MNKYTVTESFRYKGETYHPGDSIELTADEAASLAGLVTDTPAGATTGDTAGSQTGQETGKETGGDADLQKELDQLKLDKADLEKKLEKAGKDYAALQQANEKNVGELKAAKEKVIELGKQIGELKANTKKEGGKK